MLPWSMTRDCLFRNIRRRLPIATWIPSYSLPKFVGDVIAGLAVGLMLVPQSLAIAKVAGLPPHYGLYSSFPGPFVYLFLGTCKDLNVGPTVIIALVAGRYNPHRIPELASTLTFLGGIILTAAGFLNLGFVVRLISIPVFGAFIAAAAISISINQLQDLLGLPAGPRHVVQRLIHIVRNINETRTGDTILGTLCFLVLASIGILAKHVGGRDAAKKWPELLKNAIKVLNIVKSALVVILTTLISYLIFIYGDKSTFKITGPLPEGFPTMQSPLQTIQMEANKTQTVTDSIASFGAGLAIVPLVAYIESIAVAKTLAMRSRYEVNASQEMIAVGISNIFASFFNAFPITGSFARSAVNNISGAVTPISGVVAACLVILALQFITSVFQYIPITILSAMVIASVLPMIDFNLPRSLWDRDRLELLPYLATFGATFYQMEFGIIVGTSVSLCVLMYKIMYPEIAVQKLDDTVARLQVNGPMLFPCSEIVTQELQKLSESAKSCEGGNFECMEIQIDCAKSNGMDLTFAVKLKQKIVELEGNGLQVTLINVECLKMKNILRKNGIVVDDSVNFEADECQNLIFETSV